MVTMSHNMLPFEWKELFRYRFSFMTLKLLILRYAQKASFKNSDGLIFLTDYAKNNILKCINKSFDENFKIIPHGIDSQFFCDPRSSLPIDRHY